MDTLPEVDGAPFWQHYAAPGSDKDTFKDIIEMMNTVYTGYAPRAVQHWRQLPWAQGPRTCLGLAGCLLLAAVLPAGGSLCFCSLWA